jgi:hypothetical protein
MRGTLGAADISYFLSFAIVGVAATLVVLNKRR